MGIMKKNHQLSFVVIGLALFSMFFGSGNLIYPLFIGHLAEGQWIPATLGFLITAVLVPIAGVAAMVVYKGDYTAFFGCLGKKLGFLMAMLLLVVWIPLGSGPRCATLAFASILPYVGSTLPLWLFSIVYCAIVYWVVYKKNRMLDILGYVLTPLLLLCLGLIIVFGVDFSAISPHSSMHSYESFFRGLQEGYNTMDLIASFFFSASVIEILRRSSHNESLSLSITLKASLVGAFLLGVVYIGLIGLAASQVAILQSVPKDQLLVTIAHAVLGAKLGVISSVAVLLACFTTSVALATVFADFLAEKVFNDEAKYPLALTITQIVTFGMSITGLQGISFVTGPILQVFYPILMVLIVFNVGREIFTQKQEEKTVRSVD